MHGRHLIYIIISPKFNAVRASITDLKILEVLVTRLIRRDLDRLVNGMEPVELWDEG
jgi:hypothetical protein